MPTAFVLCPADAHAVAHPARVGRCQGGQVAEGQHPRAGFNSGVMLFRRSKWTKQFLEAVAELGRVPEPELGEVRLLLRSARVPCPRTFMLSLQHCQPLVSVHW